MPSHPTESSDDPCHHVAIADNAVGQVSLCSGCGQVHLTLAHVSLRFTPEAFRALGDLAATAQFRLDHIADAGHAAAAVIDAARRGPRMH